MKRKRYLPQHLVLDLQQICFVKGCLRLIERGARKAKCLGCLTDRLLFDIPAYCERLMGTIRRECLDYVIPISEMHLRKILREWVTHYNQGRPHASLGPGIPWESRPQPRPSVYRHELPVDCRIRAQDVLGGLHHEYWLEEIAA